MPENEGVTLEWLLEALYVHDATGRITRINQPGGERAPCFAMVRTATERRWRFRDDTPGEVAARLNMALSVERPQSDLRAEPHSLHALRAAFPDAVVRSGPEFFFPEAIRSGGGAIRLAHGQLGLLAGMGWEIETPAEVFAQWEPMFAVVEHGRAVSVCFSSRLTGHVAEAGVVTLPEWRGRGYASRVTAAWANAVRVGGRIPIYGTTWENEASRAVAGRLDLIPFAASFSLG